MVVVRTELEPIAGAPILWGSEVPRRRSSG